MKLTGTFILSGAFQQVGKKDPSKTYYLVLFRELDGAQTMQCMANEQVFADAKKLPEFSRVTALVDFNPTYNSIRLEGISGVPTAKAS